MKSPRCFSALLALFASVASLAGPSSAGAAQYEQRLSNLSTRAQVGTGANIMITGFVVNDGAPKKILIRAAGLSLAKFGLTTGTLANPTLSLFDGTGQLVLQSDNWDSTDVALTAATSAAGAFALGTTTANGSNDSALVATLSPGAYTAQVSGVGNTSGIALLEVYDLTGSARLINLSTRAVVAPGNGILISGLVIAPGAGTRRLLIRAAGPSLTPLGVAGALSDPVFSIFDGKAVIIAGGSNDNWDSGTAANVAAVTAAVAQAGAFPFTAGSKDSALLIDLTPGSYTIQVAGVGGTGGVALVEVYDLTPESLSTVGVAATVAAADSKSSAPAIFTLTRVGNLTAAVNVAYTLGGTAISGADYVPVSGVAAFAAGASTATVALVPKANAANLNNRTATLTLVADKTYGVSVNDSASVSFYTNTGTLYVSNLRTPATVVGSSAYGTATIQLASDEKSAFVNVAFSNLSSPEVVAHLQIDGNYVYNLPQGQVGNAYWDFAPTGTYSTADLIAALKAGRITVSIDSATFTTGELTGNFVKNTGSATFNAPAAAPALDLTKITTQDAARFLTQATFGPKNDEIYALTTKGYSAWLTEQMALPASLHFTEANADFALNMATGAGGNANAVPPQPNTRVSAVNRQHAWWKLAVNAPDQLRQRVAFALSEILVTSDQNSTIANWEDGHTNYYDLLVRGAFGNFRQLLEDATLSPNMGIYLSSLRNAKATFNAQGVQLTQADENYAREIMQLLTIGLNELQPDGTLKLDINGQPIATYTQDTIVQMAKIFTGWGFYQSGANPNFRGTGPGSESYLNPMVLYPAFHDDTVKTIVSGKVIPVSQGGAKDLKDALDALFNHPNTGPFISRQLIQRLVTSNPSPGYIYRVASAFANNGAGVRGDLGAVVRAVLTDYEARSSVFLNTAGYGKAKEPLLRATSILRAFNGASDAGRYTNAGASLTNPETIGTTSLAQAAARAPTVFNFFEPGYVLPGALAAAGLYAPEFQILTDTTAITIPNYLYSVIYSNRNAATVGLALTDVLPLAKTPQQLVDYMNLVMSAGSLPKTMTDVIVSAITRMPASTSDTDKVRSALYLVVSAPAGSIQK
ncbi:MAG: DUF1800 domain-containing protein [Undibacterium sp.]|nr:DUF1800 domain-containing protein [Opitutaceae bacterium]